jgi:hypothetical protein
VGLVLQTDFSKEVKSFEWLKAFKGSILGICAGMQILGLLYGKKLKKQTEIGFYHERFNNFLGLDGEKEVIIFTIFLYRRGEGNLRFLAMVRLLRL